MWNEPTQEQLADLPRLYETEEVPLADKIIAMHFFLGGCDWWIVEFDGKDLLWGYAVLNGDQENGEWGYISLSELRALKVRPGIEVDFDLHWTPKQAKDIPQIERGIRR